MTTRIMTAMAAALVGLALSAAPGRGGEECDNVIENIEDAVQVASKLLELELADVTKKKPDDDKEKALLRNKFCSASGEFLGVSRVYRLLADECMRGSKRRQTTASLDDSIKSLEKSVRDTCE